MQSLIHKRVPPRFIEEYLEVLAKAQSFQLSNTRHWSLLKCYAELQYKLNGGAKCPICRAHVRHVVPVRAERPDGHIDEFPCLCTRCFEGERAVSKSISMRMGEACIVYGPHQYGARTRKMHTKAAFAVAAAAGTAAPKRSTAHPMPTPPPV